MKRHMKVEHELSMIPVNSQCGKCGKYFSTNGGRKQHEITSHGNMEYGKFNCEKCAKVFCTQSSLTKHIDEQHIERRIFACDVCPKSFKRKHHLEAHILTHTGEKPFQCDHCDQSFSKEWTKIQHKRRHTGEKPYKCSPCGVCFNQRILWIFTTKLTTNIS